MATLLWKWGGIARIAADHSIVMVVHVVVVFIKGYFPLSVLLPVSILYCLICVVFVLSIRIGGYKYLELRLTDCCLWYIPRSLLDASCCKTQLFRARKFNCKSHPPSHKLLPLKTPHPPSPPPTPHPRPPPPTPPTTHSQSHSPHHPYNPPPYSPHPPPPPPPPRSAQHW